MNQFREHVVSADPECPRMCKMKFKPSSMKGFPMSELYDSLGTTKVRDSEISVIFNIHMKLRVQN